MSGNVQETPPSHEDTSNPKSLDSAQLTSLFEAAPDAMVVLDDEGTYVEANAAACELFGLPREQLLQTSIADFAEPGFDFQQAWDYLLSHGQARGEFRLLRPDGELRAVDYAATANFSPHRHLSVLRPIIRHHSRSHHAPARQRHLVEIVERTSDLIGTADAQGNIFFVNEAWQTYFDQGTLESSHISSFHPSWALEIILKQGLPEAQTSGIWRGETAILARGEEVPVEQLIMYHPGDLGEPPFFSTIMRDIRDRKADEQARQQLTEELQKAQAIAHIGSWSFDMRTDIITWSEETFRIFGLDPHQEEPSFPELVNQIHPSDRPLFLSRVNAARDQGQPQAFDYRILRSKGDIAYISNRTEVEMKEGEVVRLFGTVWDISDRKSAELELERFFNISLDLLCIADFSGRFRRVNPSWQRVLGYDISELEQFNLLDLVHPDDITITVETLGGLAENQPISEFVNRYRTKSGDYRYIEWLAAPEGDLIYAAARDITERKTTEAEVQELLSRTQILSDITQAIRNSLDLKVIVQNAVTAIFDEIEVDICTFGWCRQTDSSDESSPRVEIQVLVQKKHPKIKDWLGTHILEGFVTVYDSILRNTPYYLNSVDDCTDEDFKRICRETGINSYCCLPICSINGYWGIFELSRISNDSHWDEDEMELLSEISNQIAIAIQQAELYQEAQSKSEELSRAYRELQDTQVQLVQAEKMSSLGQLVAGIAHEINNPVNFIYGNLQYTHEYASSLLELVEAYQQHYPNPPGAIAQFIDEIELDFLKDDFHQLITSMRNGATRIRDIVKSLRTFSRLDEAELKAVDLHENLDSTLVILQNRLKGHGDHPGIKIIKNYGQLPNVECYSGLLNQVFMNLLVNAIDAIDQRKESLTLEQQVVYQGCITITTRIDNHQVYLSIRDNGVGMSRQVREQIFNPFFTTKPVGTGTGMGLPTSYQIISKYHNGELICNSTLGAGTELIIQLPAMPRG
ncbi:PAS domain S-box protein [Sodalinema gerasimenkoae]|uniref:PAS domain S-box protein n=1 Tax=Sodalinema gerasimenkoae TaxID=2862348 RepID=UPI0013584969|nr:PAS domain S-box protein [Sodalinema gerasimenkoae]